MASTFTWLDYSERERRRMLEAISLFNEPGTLDELGIGGIRDRIADLLFPGTSTVQTRARYFLFIPWIYLQLEQQPQADLGLTVRTKEIVLIKALLSDTSVQEAERAGVIGFRAGERLRRLPSNIYWQGLKSWGILNFSGSQAEYHRALRSAAARQQSSEPNDDDEPVAGTRRTVWRSDLPPSPDKFPQRATFRLRPEEAEYLRDRVLDRHPRSMFAYLLEQPAPPPATDFPWQYPGLAVLPSDLRELLGHAQLFSMLHHGAALFYNAMLAEKADRAHERAVYYNRIAGWFAGLMPLRPALESWDLTHFWAIVESTDPGISVRTKAFVASWIDHVRAIHSPEDLLADGGTRTLIADRERLLKRSLARLDNQRALELWRGESGTQQLHFRWRVAYRIISDIMAGLAEGADA